MSLREINFDGLIGPTHNYAGLSLGNVASASIPRAMRAALDEGAIQPGSRVLLSAYGAGMSYGSVLVEY